MPVRSLLVSLTILLLAISAENAAAQGSLRRQNPETATTDSSGNLKAEADSASKGNLRIRGVVVTADGAAPEELVEIDATCPGFERLMAIADSKGKFTFSFDAGRLTDGSLLKDCRLYASLEGYRSAAASFADVKSSEKLLRFVLQPIASDSTGLVSAADERASGAQKKAYGKALDKAAKQDWNGAIATLQELVSAYPGYSSAWLRLGILQQMQNDRAGAEKSYLESARADSKFALPLVRAAAIEALKGNMPAALTHSQGAIDLNPQAFPDAYALNAIANIMLQNTSAAEKSAREGLRLDTTHQYPESEYALGLVLYSQDDRKGAEEHLQKYLDLSPGGPNAAGAKNQLAQMRGSDGAVKRQRSTEARSNEPTAMVLTAEPSPSIGALRDRNAPLLAKMSAYTCLESISATKIDVQGRPLKSDMIRVDVGISDGKEIYGQADGKRLAEATDLLGYSFSTTGLFKSIAPALLAGNQVAIEAAGTFIFAGEPVLRYNFHSMLGAAPWTVAHGKESGTAAEEGWFLVNSKTLELRRVFVRAASLSGNLKLTNLSALIDYESETLAGRRALLPSAAKVEAGERSGIKRVSVMSFDHCRAFTSGSTVLFTEASLETESSQKTSSPRLPDGIDVAVSFNSPVSPATADENDALTATAARAVVWKGHELIAKGAAVEGHIRVKRGENSVVIELDRINTQRGWAPFYAQLISLDAAGQTHIQNAGAKAQAHHDDDPDLTDFEIPGVATIRFNTRAEELPAGTQMVWRTEPLFVAPKEAPIPQMNTSMGLR